MPRKKLQVAEPEKILTNPDQYRGKVVALHGVIDKVSTEHRTFTIIDLKEANRAAAANARTLIVTDRGGSELAILKVGQEAVVIGQF